ncbi:MAG: hypothetical protein Q4C86_07700 [bacterium]|nr:hypothetical protein [bacterium]
MGSRIQLFVNGVLYEGWKGATVERSVDAVSGSFRLSTGDRWEMNRDPLRIKPGDKCVVKINDISIITGWVDGSSRSTDALSHRVEITGRDATCDIVDCSAAVSSFEIHGQTLAGLARLLCSPFNLMVDDKAQDREVFPTVAVQPGETVWNCLERQARQRDVFVITDGLGRIVLCRLPEGRADDMLVLGGNVLRASVDLDHTNLFSLYAVKGQMPATGSEENVWNEPQNAVEATASDTNIKRYRPLILTSESQVYEKSASLRAEREMRRRIGDAVEVSVEVQGWTQSGGALWPLGASIVFQAPALGFTSAELIISEVANNIDDGGGIVTTLRLKHPDAFLSDEQKKKSKKKKSKEDYSAYWGDECE